VVHLYTIRVMVSTVRLVFCHLFLQLVVNGNNLLLSPGSPATSAGLNQSLAWEYCNIVISSLAFHLVTKHNITTVTKKHIILKSNDSLIFHAQALESKKHILILWFSNVLTQSYLINCKKYSVSYELRSVLQGLIPKLILSQECHIHMGPINMSTQGKILCCLCHW
jgi:hypothetical protein